MVPALQPRQRDMATTATDCGEERESFYGLKPDPPPGAQAPPGAPIPKDKKDAPRGHRAAVLPTVPHAAMLHPGMPPLAQNSLHPGACAGGGSGFGGLSFGAYPTTNSFLAGFPNQQPPINAQFPSLLAHALSSQGSDSTACVLRLQTELCHAALKNAWHD